jgi:hypothetical protein
MVMQAPAELPMFINQVYLLVKVMSFCINRALDVKKSLVCFVAAPWSHCTTRVSPSES